MATKDQLAWLEGMVPAAQTTARLFGVPASITLAQCILESGWGASQLSRDANNFFGIKAIQGQDYAEYSTREVVQGRSVMEQARFARYGTVIDCFAAHAHLLATQSRYARAMQHADDPCMFAAMLQACGYSTEPSYGARLFDLIRQHNLQRYDVLPSPAQPVSA